MSASSPTWIGTRPGRGHEYLGGESNSPVVEWLNKGLMAVWSPYLKLRLRRLPVVQPEVIARLQIDGQRAIRVGLERHVHIKRQVLAVLQQQTLVYVRRFLEVAAEVVDGGQAELVLRAIRQLLVVHHELAFVVEFVGHVEEDAGLQLRAWTLEGRKGGQEGGRRGSGGGRQ
eukprot:1196097-Prorocentrum_minimum.AAC.6